MKKKLAITLAVVLTAGMMTGCGKEAEVQTPDTPESKESVSTESSTADVSAEEVYLKDFAVEDYLTLNGDYKGLTLTVEPKTEVSEEEIAALALQAYNNSVTAQLGGITDRAVAEGDKINLDYSGKKDDVAFDGGTAADQQLVIGSGSFIDGFEEGLVGVMPGETVDLNLTFPEVYERNEELAGQAVVFTVTVNYIYPAKSEEMLDEVMSELTNGEYPTVTSFMEYCGEYLEYVAENEYQAAKESAVIEKLEELVTIESYPEELIAKYTSLLTTALDTQAAEYGLDADTYCGYFFGMDAASYAAEAAQASVRQGLLFQYVAEKEGLLLSEEELDAELSRFAEENHVENMDDLFENATREDYREYFMFQHVVDFVIEHAAEQ